MKISDTNGDRNNTEKWYKKAFDHLSTPNIITIIKSEVMRLRGLVTSMGENGYA
jgi:hypothetical protein